MLHLITYACEPSVPATQRAEMRTLIETGVHKLRRVTNQDWLIDSDLDLDAWCRRLAPRMGRGTRLVIQPISWSCPTRLTQADAAWLCERLCSTQQ